MAGRGNRGRMRAGASRYWPGMSTVLTSFCPVGSKKCIRGAVFVEVVRNPSTYDGRADTVPWLIGIARHRLARHYREQGRLATWFADRSIRPTDPDATGGGGDEAAWSR